MHFIRQISSLKTQVIKNTVVASGLKITATGLILLSNLLLAHYLGASGLGAYAYAIALTNLLFIPASLGLNKLIVREVSTYQTQSDWNRIQGLLRWSRQTVLLISVGLMLVAWGLGYWLRARADPQILITFGLTLLALPLSTLESLNLSAVNGFHRTIRSLLPDLLLDPILLIGMTFSLHLILQKGFTPLSAAGIYVFCTVVTLLVSFQLLNQALPEMVRKATPKYNSGNWLRAAFPMMMVDGIQIVNMRLSLLMLGTLQGADAVGIYVVVQRASQVITLILGTVNTVLAPVFAKLYAQKKLQELQQLIAFSSRLVLCIAILIAFILIYFNHWFLSLFGADFSQGKNALIILSLGQLVNASTGSVGVLLNMTGNERYTALSAGVGLCINIIFNVFLIPVMGISGAAIATASSLAIVNLLKVFWVRQKLGYYPTQLF
jgi:O-antigen/teichoic acid export membrane protein